MFTFILLHRKITKMRMCFQNKQTENNVNIFDYAFETFRNRHNCW